MKIDSIKIAGFKSFADTVVFPVSDGITGIVGPNGCGKSNLIESLRWAMGETSAKRMRADGMDDVIFGGTDIRPPRASCEVTITLDNFDRTAPIEFNSEDRLDVSRKISRGDGSAYKVNGRTARARDVQILFKDAGIGAGSSALVSQGKVGAIINAKPSERRSILEEAAGVAGLATRRHEAELRLKATEQNLERAEDMEKGLSEQLNSLRRQARQAKRRREIDGLILSAEAQAFLVRWTHLSGRLASGLEAFQAIEESVKEAMLARNEAERNLQEIQAEAEPALKARLEAETLLAMATARVESLRKEAQNAKAALASAKRSVERMHADIEREQQNIGDSGEAYEDLKDRKAIAEDDRDYDTVLIEEAAALVEEAKQAFDEISIDVQERSQAFAVAVAERTAAQRRLDDAISRKVALDRKFESATGALAASRERLREIPEEDGLVVSLESDLLKLESEISELLNDLAIAQDYETELRSTHGALIAELSAREAEFTALASVESEDGVAVSVISVRTGYEGAVAAALGEGAAAGIGSGKHKWWEISHGNAGCPVGGTPLSEYVEAPAELNAFLSGVGVFDDEEAAQKASKKLQPGQIAVTVAGQVWRWDGYRSHGYAGAKEQIKRAARLKNLVSEISDLKARELHERNVLTAHIGALTGIKERLNNSKTLQKKTMDDLAAAKHYASAATKERLELISRVSSLENQVAELKDEIEAAVIHVDEADGVLRELSIGLHRQEEIEELRSKQRKAERSYEEAREQLDKRRRDAEARVLLLQNIDQQISDFDRRLVASKELVKELEERYEEGLAEIEVLAAADVLAPDAEITVMEGLDEAIAIHSEATEGAKNVEERLDVARGHLREVEGGLAALKEDRARIQAEHKASHDAAQELAREVGERLSCDPSRLPELAGMVEGDELPDLASCEARVQRLIRERDALGTVNLLAEQQVAEVEGHLGDAGKARDELREAVKRLRSTISEFDREARERLTEAFNLIDGHFRELFSRLFVGGYAHLNLSGSDDILEAGLEIYACPPGKKLQTMSLLSGGEQAMAALALIFAAFLIRPAPVCVLDEVDAALDEANIDRLVSLVEDMAKNNTTRFLVITHREMTMSRCDRLYGVTMMERGVSKLTSLDMASAIRLIEERV